MKAQDQQYAEVAVPSGTPGDDTRRTGSSTQGYDRPGARPVRGRPWRPREQQEATDGQLPRKLIVQCAVDGEGNRMFNAGDVAWIGGSGSSGVVSGAVRLRSGDLRFRLPDRGRFRSVPLRPLSISIRSDSPRRMAYRRRAGTEPDRGPRRSTESSRGVSEASSARTNSRGWTSRRSTRRHRTLNIRLPSPSTAHCTMSFRAEVVHLWLLAVPLGRHGRLERSRSRRSYP